jgi:hypothetical protein
MAKSRALDQIFLTALYQGATATSDTFNLFSGFGTATVFFMSLLTSTASATDGQTANEISYTGYSRPPINRSATGFAISAAGVISPLANITFGNMVGGAGGTAVSAAIGAASSGVGQLLHIGALSPTIVVSNGVTPQITTASTITET